MNKSQQVQTVEAWESQFKRPLLLVEINGVSKNLFAWARESKAAYRTIIQRYANGVRGEALLADPAYKGYGSHRKPGPRKKLVKRIWAIFYKRFDSHSPFRLEYRFGNDTKEKKNKLEFFNRSEARKFCYEMNATIVDLVFTTKMIQGEPYKRKTKREYAKIRERKNK